MIRFETLLEKVRSYSPEADLELLRQAYAFSAAEHKGPRTPNRPRGNGGLPEAG